MSKLTQEQALKLLTDNAHRIPWDNPDKIIVADIAGRDNMTFLQVLCLAYNLKPNE